MKNKKELLSFFLSFGCKNNLNRKKKSFIKVLLKSGSILGQWTRKIPSLLSLLLLFSFLENH